MSVCIYIYIYSFQSRNRAKSKVILWGYYYFDIGEGNGNPLQYSCLENPMDRGAWWAAVHGVMKSQTRLSDFTFTFHFHALEKEMATHSSVLTWRILGMGEPGGLPSMGSHRVGPDWSNLAAAAAETLLWYKNWITVVQGNKIIDQSHLWTEIDSRYLPQLKFIQHYVKIITSQSNET